VSRLVDCTVTSSPTGIPYDLGITQEVCAMQVSKDLAGVSEKDMANVVIAYEPVWAIG